MDEGEDYDWQPPSEAEMKVLQARRERQDKISQMMGEYLLKGYKMLATSCTKCQTILMQDRQGTDYCVACSELDSDAVKDDPAMSPQAAEAQVREHERAAHGSTGLPESTGLAGHIPSMHHNGLTREQRPLTIRSLSRSDSAVQTSIVEYMQTETTSQLQQDVQRCASVLHCKLNWATDQLVKAETVEASIQLCHLIKTCAETMASLKSLQK